MHKTPTFAEPQQCNRPSILMKNYKNKLQNSNLLNVMRNFDQSNTLPEFDLELFIHCGLELAR
jgi:hypothetical protein